jgi:hypothetical protein
MKNLRHVRINGLISLSLFLIVIITGVLDRTSNCKQSVIDLHLATNCPVTPKHGLNKMYSHLERRSKRLIDYRLCILSADDYPKWLTPVYRVYRQKPTMHFHSMSMTHCLILIKNTLSDPLISNRRTFTEVNP